MLAEVDRSECTASNLLDQPIVVREVLDMLEGTLLLIRKEMLRLVLLLLLSQAPLRLHHIVEDQALIRIH